MSSPSSLPAKYRADVAAFEAVRPDYEVLKAIIERALKRAAREMGMEAIVQARAKELASYAEKSIRKQKEYPDPVNMMNDLCGVRVITESTNDIAPICAFIRKHFDVDEATTEDTGARLGIGEFGYRSVHFTIALKPNELLDDIAAVLGNRPDGEAVTSRLLVRRTPAECDGKPYGPGPRYRAEVQVRSLLQHAWANLYHDRVYKSEFRVPNGLRRDLMRIAAILEDADENFARVIGSVDGYREYYGTYLPQERLEEELEKLQQLREFDTKNLKLALKIARVAVSLERWTDVVAILEPFVIQWESDRAATLDGAMKSARAPGTPAEQRRAREALDEYADTRAANLLLDYGTAKWHLNEKARARQCLDRATGLDLGSADALIALADTYEGETGRGFWEALRLYGNAYAVNPLEPRAARGYLQLTAEKDRNLAFVAPMRPTLHVVIQRCRERVILGIYLPWAYFDIGCFSLLLGDEYEGLSAYAKAVELSHSDTPIDVSLGRARRLCDALHETGNSEWSLLERLLLIAKVAKRYRLASDAMVAVRSKEETVAKLSKEEAEAARPELDKARAVADALLAEANAVRAALIPDIANARCPTITEKVVIVAGGCAPEEEQKLHEYSPLLKTAFQDFAGTIFSGGTCSGIGQMVGDLPDSSRGPIQKVTCLPEALPTYHQLHTGYALYMHPGQGFSPLGAVQVWADILSQGIAPSSVRLLGISGGRLAGWEYRLALMMGAKVGIVTGSGRAADAIFEDPEWTDHPNLIPLPYDPQIVKVFTAGVSSAGILSDAQREEAARIDHERNVERRRRESVVDDRPENQPWDTLRTDLKESIRERVDFIAEQLRAVGLRVVEQGQIPEGTSAVDELTPEQVEIMAEMEHGRWYVQKCFSGWRFGPKKDEQLRTHPDLIAWERLAEKERDKDRHYARRIPSLLSEQGYAIIPAAA